METNKQEDKTFSEILCNTKLNLIGLQFLKEVEAEIDKVDVSKANNTCEFEAMVGWSEGLKRAIQIFQNIKNRQ